MKHFLRPYQRFSLRAGLVALVAGAVWGAMTPVAARAQAQPLVRLLDDSSPLLSSASAQGYLGVDVEDVDAQKAQALKLREARGAVITLIDHDAPAGQIGLRVNDVVLQFNGQTVDSADQLRHMLREIPPGRKVSIEISRDGNIQTLAVEMADRKVVEHDAWNRIGNGGDIFPTSTPAMSMLASGSGSAPSSSGFHFPFFGSSLNVGAMVEPLTSQMAEYLGVHGGVMVKQVARRSEADSAGLHAFDVILKVGQDTVLTLSDWGRALRSHQGQPVQVTILRDRKQQVITLQVDSRHHGKVNYPRIFSAQQQEQLAELN